MKARAGEEKNAPSFLADILDSVLGKFGIKTRLKENEVFAVWEQAVGDAVARNCRPKTITDGILVIETKNNVWMQELSLLRQEIMDSINKHLGWEGVKDLRFRIGTMENAPQTKSGGEKRNPAAREKLDPQTEREMEQALAGIEDDELKEALRGLMIRGVKRPKR